jgi:hypothetical protein
VAQNVFLMTDRQAVIQGPDQKKIGPAMKTIFGIPGKGA